MGEQPAPSEPARLVERANSQRKRFAAEAIERSALELFRSEPVENVTVGHIAAAAGVSVRSFYRYFTSKEEILLALPERLARAIADETLRRPPGESGFEAVRAAISDLTQDDHPELQRWQQAVATARAGERMSHQVVAVTSPVLVEALAERTGRPATELWPSLAGVLVATALVVAARRWEEQGGSLRAHILDAVDLAGHGLAAPDLAAPD
jgi:AcrR family transcriptional regulator